MRGQRRNSRSLGRAIAALLAAVTIGQPVAGAATIREPSKVTITDVTKWRWRGGGGVRYSISGDVAPAHPGGLVILRARMPGTSWSDATFRKGRDLGEASAFSFLLPDYGWCQARVRFVGDEDHKPDSAYYDRCR